MCSLGPMSCCDSRSFISTRVVISQTAKKRNKTSLQSTEQATYRTTKVTLTAGRKINCGV